MMSEKMADAINGQINAELYSAYLYLSMQTWFDAAALPGCAGWMRAQAKEEFSHTDRLWHIMTERGSRVTMTAIDAPATEWASPLAVFEAVYVHEQKVTSLIKALAELADAEKDQVTVDALQWFIDEQEEEEESAETVVRKLRDAGDSAEALAAIDRELGARGSKPPTASAE